MAVYAIGDVQGCHDPLLRLLEKIRFNPTDDQIWFCGDLVNRGPNSLEVLRFVKSLNHSAVAVLGNHDFHLLACSRKKTKPKNNSLHKLLAAEDRDELLLWLRHLPLMYRNDQFCLVHAGLPPQWDLEKANSCAQEVHEILRGDSEQYRVLLDKMYGDSPDCWSEALRGWDRVRFIINCFTRLRFCDKHGKLDLTAKERPGNQAKQLVPWFSIPNRKSRFNTIIFGHWSALGFFSKNNCYCIDTGCFWGGELTALRLDDEMTRTSVECRRYKEP